VTIPGKAMDLRVALSARRRSWRWSSTSCWSGGAHAAEAHLALGCRGRLWLATTGDGGVADGDASISSHSPLGWIRRPCGVAPATPWSPSDEVMLRVDDGFDVHFGEVALLDKCVVLARVMGIVLKDLGIGLGSGGIADQRSR